MTKKDLIKAERLLAPYVDRTERAGVDKGGLCLTAYWRSGGQKIFYALAAVEDRVQEIKTRSVPESNPDMIITTRIPASLHAELTLVADAEERTQAAVIRLAIREYLDHCKK